MSPSSDQEKSLPPEPLKAGPLTFEVTSRDPGCEARTGIVNTCHGSFETPVFMPVGTQATVKTLTPKVLEEAGSEIILSNAYHLYIRPGIDIIRQFGGLHRFMGWDKPILTDSGGFQVFSLSRLREITEEGASFYSQTDGRKIFLTPEHVVEIQEAIGSDIAMIFDECPPPTKDRDRIRQALERTIVWSKRAHKHHKMENQSQFGIVQGGIFDDLREESLERTLEIEFDGYALGGLAVGESREDLYRVMAKMTPRLPADKPRYLMGIGTPLDFLQAVEHGADMFDCVNPTRYGRNGTAFTPDGLVVVRNGKYAREEAPIDAGCGCYCCQNFSRAYLRHLFNASEILGPQLVSLHNVYFFVNFLKAMRTSIRNGEYLSFKKAFLTRFDSQLR